VLESRFGPTILQPTTHPSTQPADERLHPAKDPTVPSPTDGLPELDPVLHAQTRLQLASVLARLSDGQELIFPQLQELLGLTAGNLSTHLRRLEEAGYVAVSKAHRDRLPVTGVALTGLGRERFVRYAQTMRDYLDGSAVDRILAMKEPS
jgi:DNA-binding transcriptional ArsR family regulator